MRPVFAAASGNANPNTDKVGGGYRHDLRSMWPIVQKSRALWPEKTAPQLALRANVSVRAAERWLAGGTEMTAGAFIALLRSDEGFAFLDAVMSAMPRQARAKWWQRLTLAARRVDLEQRQQALAQEIKAFSAEEEQLLLGIK